VKVDWNEVNRIYGGEHWAYKFYDPEDESGYEDEATKKWELLRKPVIPEPIYEEVDYEPTPEERLSKKFASSGLQVIVKIASIELTPDKPEFPVGGWHVGTTKTLLSYKVLIKPIRSKDR
jgi:hypothetical protein